MARLDMDLTPRIQALQRPSRLPRHAAAGDSTAAGTNTNTYTGPGTGGSGTGTGTGGTGSGSDAASAEAGGRRILNGVTLTIPAGQTVAIVGSSGSGKSTLLRLLYRFYDAGAGRITVDGQDIRGVTLRSLRAKVRLYSPYLAPI